MRYDIKQRLALIKSPTLLVSGSRCEFIDKLEITNQIIPSSRAYIIEGTGSGITHEKPREYANAILEFLERPGERERM